MDDYIQAETNGLKTTASSVNEVKNLNSNREQR